MNPEFLKNISKEMPFEVPEGYFRTLPGRISRRIGQEAETSPDRAAQAPPVFRRAERFKTAAAACIALLLGVLGILQVARNRDSATNSATSVMNFDQDILIQEYLKTYDPEAEEKPGELETYLLNQVEEGMLLQEL